MNDYFTIQEVAKELGMSRQSVDKRIRSRKVSVRVFGKTRVVTAEGRAQLISS